MRLATLSLASVMALPAVAQTPAADASAGPPGPDIDPPSATARPVTVSPTGGDAFLEAVLDTMPVADFRNRVGDAVNVSPAISQSLAGLDEAEAARREARSGLFPIIDLALTGRTSFARNFSNDPDNVVERARSRGRADATAVLDQRVFDFGATSNRIAAASSNLRAAAAEVERQTDLTALQAIGAWYDVYSYQYLVEMMIGYIERQNVLRDAVLQRIALGASAQGDVARVDSEIASSTAQLAQFRRQLGSAAARFEQLYQMPMPPTLNRAPLVGGRFASIDAVRAASLESPVMRIADEQAEAARRTARAQRSDTLPTVNAGVEAGRFGVFSGNNDYDVRGTVSVRQRFFGPGDARADQAEARADAQEARAEGIRLEVLRQATTAWTDFEAYRDELAAAEEAYVASLRSREVIIERFRATRGTLFDVLQAEDDFIASALQLVQTISEHDTAHFILLSRTGRLLEALDIDPDAAVAMP